MHLLYINFCIFICFSFCNKIIFATECQQYISRSDASIATLSRNKRHFGWSIILQQQVIKKIIDKQLLYFWILNINISFFRIVATQLGADLTKHIVITDPYRIKAPAERVLTEFHLPIGVQLLQVYIERKQFAKLLQETNNERYYNSCLDTVTKKMLQRRVSIREKYHD